MRYYKFSDFLKKRFGNAVFKVVVDAGFSCPNRDGTKGVDGCVFCNNEAFSPALANRGLGIKEQIEIGIKRVQRKRKKATQFMAYFQPFSNTYGQPEYLRKVYYEALSSPDIVALAIGTRADCINEDVLEILNELASKTHLWVELGLESSHNETLNKINRGHSFEEFVVTFKKLKKIPHLYICVHLIHGLPGESKEMMLETIKKMNTLKPDAVKFHQLEVVKNTKLEQDYLQGKIKLLTLDEYLEILGDSLQILSSNIIIQRLFGFTPSGFLIAPQYEGVNYMQLLETYLQKKNIVQGACYEV